MRIKLDNIESEDTAIEALVWEVAMIAKAGRDDQAGRVFYNPPRDFVQEKSGIGCTPYDRVIDRILERSNNSPYDKTVEKILEDK